MGCSAQRLYWADQQSGRDGWIIRRASGVVQWVGCSNVMRQWMGGKGWIKRACRLHGKRDKISGQDIWWGLVDGWWV